MTKTWFITGASRGLGIAIAKAALKAGDNVVATGRNRAPVTAALGADHEQLLSVQLDVTRTDNIATAVAAARDHFGGIDILVNNAGYGHLGFFEETSTADIEAQFATNVFGVFKVTRAVLPLMRATKSGRIFNLSSVAGFKGMDLASLYCASKFAVEGFSESLAAELAPFNIHVTIVEPGPFRTDFLTPESIRFGGQAIADYDDRRNARRASFEERNGSQPGDPEKLASALVTLANEASPPQRFVAGAYAVAMADQKLTAMRADFDRWRSLALATDFAA
jgi:NAD(P)-dependent dehydrogenase (short-subunit alcohol dehydrogenase family)